MSEILKKTPCEEIFDLFQVGKETSLIFLLNKAKLHVNDNFRPKKPTEAIIFSGFFVPFSLFDKNQYAHSLIYHTKPRGAYLPNIFQYKLTKTQAANQKKGKKRKARTSFSMQKPEHWIIFCCKFFFFLVLLLSKKKNSHWTWWLK